MRRFGTERGARAPILWRPLSPWRRRHIVETINQVLCGSGGSPAHLLRLADAGDWTWVRSFKASSEAAIGSKAGSVRPLPFGGVEALVRGDQASPPRFPHERHGWLPARE